MTMTAAVGIFLTGVVASEYPGETSVLVRMFEYQSGTVALICYFIAAVGSWLAWLARSAHSRRQIEQFAATDRASLLERWRMFNGREPELILPRLGAGTAPDH